MSISTTMSNTTVPLCPHLGNTNWGAFHPQMCACLQIKGVWRIITKDWTQPALKLLKPSIGANGKKISLTMEQQTLNTCMHADPGPLLHLFHIAKEKATSKVYAHFEPLQHAHVWGLEDDPVAMWDKLSLIHLQQVPGMHFTAYNKLFSIVKKPNKTLSSLAGCVSNTLGCVQDLCPSSFNVDQLNEELAVMAMIQVLLWAEYRDFASSLMCNKTLLCANIKAAFQLKQTKQDAPHGPVINANNAALCVASPVPSTSSLPPDHATLLCKFCRCTGHLQPSCFKYKKQQEEAKAEVASTKCNCHKCQHASCAKVNKSKVEQANCTQVCLAGSPSSEADVAWIADTGTTSSMTLHQSWFALYTPHMVAVCVANNKLVYSASIGDVVVTPGNPALLPCCLFCVLHVPNLQNNL
jgi:hypothetical protein